MKKYLYIILLILPLIGFGQGWETNFGGEGNDEGFSVQQTTDGGYIIGGCTSSYGNGSYDVYLLKTDGSGNEQWSQTFGGIEDDRGWSIQQTTDGGYIITGVTNFWGANGSSDVYLIKTDDNGNEQWSQTFGGTNSDAGNSVQQTIDGGYIISGRTRSYVNGSNADVDVYLIKTDGNGNELWSQTYGGTEGDYGASVQQTSDEGYIITGYTRSYGNGNGYDVYLIKTDGGGNEQWSQTFGGIEHDLGLSVQQTTDGGYIITGYTRSYGNGYDDVYLIKTDSYGNQQWSQTYGGVDNERGESVQQTTDGGYIITGYTESYVNGSDDQRDVYLIKTDSSGNEQWSQTYGGVYWDSGYSVQQTTDGGFIITGETVSPGTTNLYLIKTNEWGNITSTIELPNPQSKRELIKTTNILGQENITIKNQPLIEIYDDGSVEKKYIIE